MKSSAEEDEAKTTDLYEDTTQGVLAKLTELKEKEKQCEEFIIHTEHMLQIMRNERNEISERVLKLQTLRTSRRTKPPPSVLTPLT